MRPDRRRGAKPAPEPDEAADRRAALALVPVSRETEERLAVYVARLREWQRIKNLVAPSTLPHVWSRHVADSAQLLALAPGARTWVDLGSGAGFPGLVVAILLAGQPNAAVHLIESNARKCAFLRDVARVTGAPATVHCDRIEAVLPALPGGVEVVTARALAPVPELVAMSRSLIDRGAVGLFLAGEGSYPGPGGAAGDSADPPLRIDAVPSLTHAAARILKVTNPAAGGGRD